MFGRGAGVRLQCHWCRAFIGGGIVGDLAEDLVRKHRGRIDSRLSVLIVDDYELTRSALAHLIAVKMPNAAIHVTGDYGSAPGLCSSHSIDIVITDLRHASARAHDMFEQIISHRSGIHLILTTGSNDHEDLARVSGMPNTHLLEKPVEFSELLALVQMIVNEKRTTAVSLEPGGDLVS
jgi:DNA-binding NtrC family response regulator